MGNILERCRRKKVVDKVEEIVEDVVGAVMAHNEESRTKHLVEALHDAKDAVDAMKEEDKVK